MSPYMPRRGCNPMPTSQRRPRGVRARRAKVAERPSLLCVEDNAALAELLSYILEGAGYAVHIARTGVDAQRLATIAHPALVLLDMEVSGIDGPALSTYFRSRL